jgi:Fe-S cluster biosynthesis and repair protein YggX
MREIYCLKLKKNAPALSEPPFPGLLGERIAQHISQEAWQAWLNHQTMLINEQRLSLASKEARLILQKALLVFLFNESETVP